MSYFILISSYIITLLIILQGLIRNLLYSIYLRVIQANPNNNPYNNSNNITKINETPYKSIIANYTSIITLSLAYLFPFIIPYTIKYFNFDNYDIKHSLWFSYLILFFLLFPLIVVMLFYSTFSERLAVFPNLNKFVDNKDVNFIKFISDNFNFKIYTILPFLFIVFIYCYYIFVFINYKNTFKQMAITCLILFLIIFIFIPIVIIFFSLSIAFDNKNTDNTNNIIENIQKNGVSSLYDLLVKYNYPCFTPFDI
jgi:hypothetical protein